MLHNGQIIHWDGIGLIYDDYRSKTDGQCRRRHLDETGADELLSALLGHIDADMVLTARHLNLVSDKRIADLNIMKPGGNKVKIMGGFPEEASRPTPLVGCQFMAGTPYCKKHDEWHR